MCSDHFLPFTSSPIPSITFPLNSMCFLIHMSTGCCMCAHGSRTISSQGPLPWRKLTVPLAAAISCQLLLRGRSLP